MTHSSGTESAAAHSVTFFVRPATKRKHNDLGLTTGPNYEGQPNVSEFAGWRQLSPIPESSCFPGAGRRTTSLAQARLPVVKRLIAVYIILAATAIVVGIAVPAEAGFIPELRRICSMTQILVDRAAVAVSRCY